MALIRTALCLALSALVAVHSTALSPHPPSPPCPLGCDCQHKDPAGVSIDCQWKRMTAIPDLKSFSSGILIANLDLSYNAIQELPDGTFDGLAIRSLKLDWNKLTVIGQNAFRSLANNLEHLSLMGNRGLQGISKKALSGLNRLRILNLSNISADRTWALVSDALGSLPALEVLVLSHNNFSILVDPDAFSGLPNLQEIILEHCVLESVPAALVNLTNLRKLSLRNNHLDSSLGDGITSLDRLQFLDISLNKLHPAAMTPEVFAASGKTMTELHLEYNKLTAPPVATFAHLKRLEILQLQGNNMVINQAALFANLDALQELDLSYNTVSLKQDIFSGVEDTLESLTLQLVGLTSVPVQTLRTLKKLRKLDLSFNDILVISDLSALSVQEYIFFMAKVHTINPTAFDSTTPPVKVDLRMNTLSNLSFADPRHGGLDLLDLRTNPVACDCFAYAAAMNNSRVIRGSCETPADLVGSPIQHPQTLAVMATQCSPSSPGRPTRPSLKDRARESTSDAVVAMGTGVHYVLTLTLSMVTHQLLIQP